MTLVHWRCAEHYNSAARKTVCGVWLDDSDNTHLPELVTCRRCLRNHLLKDKRDNRTPVDEAIRRSQFPSEHREDGTPYGWSWYRDNTDVPDDDPEEFAADATSPSPEWPAIELDDEYDLEGMAFWARVRAQPLSHGEAA